jgi:hypothetical protein
MPWILAGGGVVVVAVVVVLIIVLTGGADKGSPEGVAEAAVSAFNDKDISGITDVTCNASKADVEKSLGATGFETGGTGAQLEFKAELGEVTTQGDDKATAEIKITYTKVPDEMKEYIKEGSTETGKLNLSKENGDWCVASLGA